MPSSPSNHQPARSGRDRRSGKERRVAERRRRVVVIHEERRESERRAGVERRNGADRRRRWIGGRPVTGVSTAPPADANLSARDRTKARMLPDDFIAATGDTTERLAKILRRRWTSAPRQVRAGLAEGLAPILDPLANGAPITEPMRAACEVVVTTWLAPFRRPSGAS